MDVPNEDGRTPLHSASRNGNLKADKIILGQEAAIDVSASPVKKHRWTPLHAASRNGQLETVKILLQ